MEPVYDLLPVRQLVLSAKGMHPAAKAVFAEVCALYENGGRRCFDANNRFLAEKLGITIPMVSRHLRALEKVGLLTINGTGNGERRTIAPNPDVQQAYRLETPETLTEVVRDAYHFGKGTLTEVVRNPYRSGKHNKKEVEGKKNETLTTPNEALTTSACADRAKVVELEEVIRQQQQAMEAQAQRLTMAKEEYRKLREEKLAADAEVVKLKAQLARREKRRALPVAKPMPTFEQWHPEQVQALSEEDQGRLRRFFQWAEAQPLPMVFSMNLTPRKVLALGREYGPEQLKGILLDMENSPALERKKSADLTAQRWLQRDKQREERIGYGSPQPQQAYGSQSRYSGHPIR